MRSVSPLTTTAAPSAPNRLATPAPIPFDAPVTTAPLPAGCCVFILEMFVVRVIGLLGDPVDPPLLERVQATQQNAIRKSRRRGNRHWPQPIRDAPCVTLGVSVAEVECKSGLRRTWFEKCLFPSRKASAVSPFRCSLDRELPVLLQEPVPAGGKSKERNAEREERIVSKRASPHEPSPSFHQDRRASVALS
jgi:hypothetical protein